VRRRGYDVKNLVVVASSGLGERLETRIRQRAHYGYNVACRFVYSGGGEAEAGLVDAFHALLSSRRIDDVIVALPADANDLAGRLVAACENFGVNARIVPDLSPLIRTETQVYDLDGIPLVNARLYPTEYFAYIVIKRLFDICFSLAALLVLSPLLALLALLVKLTSPGPILFSQERVGLNGRKFRMLKFRTMRQSPSLDPDSHWTVLHDSNVTKAGRWLRRFNLDELPQFINVLKGEMSIVGPRPERPFFLDRFRREVPGYMARHYVKSGMTGWAQVHGWRGDTAIPQRVAHDLYYIRNWAVALDLKILALTLRTIFQRNAG
jgi:Undecaprenyl-phosphate glucose phosphotransferase